MDVAALRKEYTLRGLYRRELVANPLEQFRLWFEESVKVAGNREPNAMTVATSSANGRPSLRVVLLKGHDERGFVFFTSYESRKAADLVENPQAAINFHWPWLERQIQIEGRAEQVTRGETEEYFNKRPLGSRFGALASHQSSVIANRAQLEDQLRAVQERFGQSDPPTPDFWGGYRVVPRRMEFWQGRENRLHDRFLYTLEPDGTWRIDRLSP